MQKKRQIVYQQQQQQNFKGNKKNISREIEMQILYLLNGI